MERVRRIIILLTYLIKRHSARRAIDHKEITAAATSSFSFLCRLRVKLWEEVIRGVVYCVARNDGNSEAAAVTNLRCRGQSHGTYGGCVWH